MGAPAQGERSPAPGLGALPWRPGKEPRWHPWALPLWDPLLSPPGQHEVSGLGGSSRCLSGSTALSVCVPGPQSSLLSSGETPPAQRQAGRGGSQSWASSKAVENCGRGGLVAGCPWPPGTLRLAPSPSVSSVMALQGAILNLDQGQRGHHMGCLGARPGLSAPPAQVSAVGETEA